MANEPYTEPLFPEAQATLLELIPYASAPISVLGSLLILRFIWCKRSESLKSVYHRLMLGISIFDLISSLGMIVLGPWTVPSFIEYTTLGSGTWETCEAAGFALNFVFGNMWYSGFLALYFLFLVRYECKEKTIERLLEPLAHFISIAFTVITALYGVVNDIINPLRILPGFCWFQDYPPFCSASDKDAATECQRGDSALFINVIGNAAALIFLFATILVSMTLIVLKVRKTESQMRQYAIDTQSITLKRTHETAWQGMLYIGSFSATFFPIAMVGVLADTRRNPDNNRGVLFLFAFLTKTLTPLQGFFNAYIFLRKRFWKLTEDEECFGFLRRIALLGRLGSAAASAEDGVDSRNASSENHNPPSDEPQPEPNP